MNNSADIQLKLLIVGASRTCVAEISPDNDNVEGWPSQKTFCIGLPRHPRVKSSMTTGCKSDGGRRDRLCLWSGQGHHQAPDRREIHRLMLPWNHGIQASGGSPNRPATPPISIHLSGAPFSSPHIASIYLIILAESALKA